MSHTIQSYIHEDTSTFTHLLVDDGSLSCAIVDPVLDYDPWYWKHMHTQTT